MAVRNGWMWTIAAVALAACGPQVGVDDGADGTDAMTTGPSGPSSMDASDVTGATDPTSPNPTDPTSPNPTDPTDPTGPTPVPTSNAVDILLVVDNSGSMGPAQARLASAIGGLVAALDGAGADWRIGVTTTDNGNPWCDGTSPEGGKLVSTSCRSRTQDFVFQGAQPVDATQEACLDLCPDTWADIPLSQPWVESIAGVTNLPPELDPAQALACLVPQGINGCGFEEQLESMYKAIKRFTTRGEESYGFMRDDAVLAILVVTDEVDCSMNKEWETIFLPDGNRVFWTNPDDAAPTSAVCWNAGVECTGGPGVYDECHGVDLDVDANPVAPSSAESDAVIRPLSRYVDYLQSIEDTKKQLNPGAELVFAVLGGFAADGSAFYADDTGDPSFQTSFGIGPGCQSEVTRGVPPVRMRQLADSFADDDLPNRFSICDTEYSGALDAFAKAILDHLP